METLLSGLLLTHLASLGPSVPDLSALLFINYSHLGKASHLKTVLLSEPACFHFCPAAHYRFLHIQYIQLSPLRIHPLRLSVCLSVPSVRTDHSLTITCGMLGQQGPLHACLDPVSVSKFCPLAR